MVLPEIKQMKRSREDQDGVSFELTRTAATEASVEGESEDSAVALQEMRRKVQKLESEKSQIKEQLESTKHCMEQAQSELAALKGASKRKSQSEESTSTAMELSGHLPLHMGMSAGEGASSKTIQGAPPTAPITEALSVKLSKTKESLNVTKEALSETKEELVETKEELSEAKKRLQSTSKTVNVLSEHLEKARLELKEVKASSADRPEVSGIEPHETKQQLKSSRKTVGLLSDSLQEAQAELAVLKESTDKETPVLPEVAAELLETKSKIQSSTEAVAVLDDNLKDAHHDLHNLKETVAAAKSNVIEPLVEAKAKLQSSGKTVTQLAGSLDEARAELTVLRESAETVKAIVSESIEAQNKLAQANRVITESLEHAQAQVKSLKEGSARSSPIGFEETKEELLTAKETLADVSAKLEKAKAELETLTDSAEAAKSSVVESLGAKDKLRAATRTVTITNGLEQAKTQLNILENTAEGAKKSVADSIGVKEHLGDTLQAAKVEIGSAVISAIGKDASTSHGVAEDLVQSTNPDEQPGTSPVPPPSLPDTAPQETLSKTSHESKIPTPLSFIAAPPPPPPIPAPTDQSVVEKSELTLEVAGRVIGKGGEVIRNLIARSGAQIDVDPSPAPGLPRLITFQGQRSKVDFAKQLVQMIASGVKDTDLPLGEARQEMMAIPTSATGKVIGRGGEIIREITSRSQAKVDFDHSSPNSEEKTVIVTGTVEAVAKAKEMISFLAANPDLDAIKALNVLVDEKLRSGTSWGTGGPYLNLPNHGSAMKIEMLEPSSSQIPAFAPVPSLPAFVPPPQPSVVPPSYPLQATALCATINETMFCKKQHVGRIIGSKGSTIKDLQQRSGTNIQIKQDVPYGADCEIQVTGSSEGINMARQMIRQIIDGGADHLFGFGGAQHANAVPVPAPAPYGHVTQYVPRQAPPPPPPIPQANIYRNSNYPQTMPPAAAVASIPTTIASTIPSRPPTTVQIPVRPQLSPTQSSHQTQGPSSTAAGSSWQAMTEPNGQTYYWNPATGISQWEKPIEMR